MLLLETGKRLPQQLYEERAQTAGSAQTLTMQKYLKATELKKWYRQENDRLYQLNACHMKVESRMGQLLDASEAAKIPLHRVPASRHYRISPLPARSSAPVRMRRCCSAAKWP